MLLLFILLYVVFILFTLVNQKRVLRFLQDLLRYDNMWSSLLLFYANKRNGTSKQKEIIKQIKSIV